MDIETWMRGYETAWRSNDGDDIGTLFTDDAEYFTEPWTPPWRGRDEIVRRWVERADAPGDWTFSWHVVGVDAGTATAFVQGETCYAELATTYSNLWVIRFADGGRAASFTEWWMDQAHASDGDGDGEELG
ncbi:ketosteroid isomerase-like protein [Schumannella luteola]|uniref:Ketosteroid isomerase-like protein n=1 Tax=Schumannella luteola TaxID=472059 RepID=A0A852YNT8_9MICO|nr:nuclear transport factor 2 family protein [Schumannella luteola]NYG99399.1 ketosteroid isomerase-like protein [Schumannella luteola]